MKKRHIVWTSRERVEIIKAAVRIMRSYPKMPMFRAVGEAQDSVLPPERRRSFINKAALGDMVTDIQRELNSPVPHVIGPAAEDAIVEAARSVAERFEAELRAALSSSTARIVKEAAEGKL